MIGAERRHRRWRSRRSRRRRTRCSARATATSTSPSVSRRPARPPCRGRATRPTSSTATHGSRGCNYDYVGAAGHAQLRPRRDHEDRARGAPATAPAARGFALVHAGPQHPGQRDDRARVRPRVDRRQLHRRRRRRRIYVRDATVDEKDGFALVRSVARRPGRGGVEQHDHRRLRDPGRDRDGRRRLHGRRAARCSFAPGQTVKTIVIPITDDGDRRAG